MVGVGRQVQDWDAARDLAAELTGVNPSRRAAWGSSLSGGHVLKVAARHPELAAVISQSPNARRWLTPQLHQRGIRRDAVKVLRSIGSHRNLLMDAVPALETFDRPALVIWASDDKVMPIEHGHRLAELLPHGRFVEIVDSYTLVPLDQPKVLADHIRSQTRT